MASTNNQHGSALARVIGVVALLIVATTPFVLHFGQKRHNVLPFDVDKQFPIDSKLVGGEAFASTIKALMEHELNGTTGWRPNDFILWGPTLWADNNSNRQLGVLQAVRESLRVLKDHLTKVSSNEFDVNLVEADTDFRNDARKLWLPSAESKFREGTRHLQLYIDGLAATPPKSRPINRRNIELIRLFQSWSDMLGDAHARLYRTTDSFFETDDDFYFAQGVAHAIYHLTRAIAHEYQEDFHDRQIIQDLLHEVAEALGKAALLKPLIVFNGNPDGIFANHRHNLDAYINEARQKIYSIREELQRGGGGS
ncbi:MAG TPA: DUF2333 family protein [Candidatus Acidoferrales bacterium]|nr:DUF2333 family protein [Candidatus Acidoferrales bacterium]